MIFIYLFIYYREYCTIDYFQGKKNEVTIYGKATAVLDTGMRFKPSHFPGFIF